MNKINQRTIAIPFNVFPIGEILKLGNDLANTQILLTESLFLELKIFFGYDGSILERAILFCSEEPVAKIKLTCFGVLSKSKIVLMPCYRRIKIKTRKFIVQKYYIIQFLEMDNQSYTEPLEGKVENIIYFKLKL